MVVTKVPDEDVLGWIPPTFSWRTEPGLFWLEAQADDPDLLELLALGSLSVGVQPSKSLAQMTSAFFGRRIKGLLMPAVWDPAKLRQSGPERQWSNTVQAYLHGAYLLPDGVSLWLSMGKLPAVALHDTLSPELSEAAEAAFAQYKAELAIFEERVAQEREAHRAQFASPELQQYEGVIGQALHARHDNERPKPAALAIVRHLPRAIIFQRSPSDNFANNIRSAKTALKASCLAGSRDAVYHGILAGPARAERNGLVAWAPYTGQTAYPEVRWALTRTLPAAFHKPRLDDSLRPELSGAIGAGSLTNVVAPGPYGDDWAGAFDDLTLDDTNYRDRVQQTKDALAANSFEAFAWYQPYHTWSEETWGIYLDARKLDDLALSLRDDFRTSGIQASNKTAALLAFGLTYAHEFFHARVEAATSWLELNAGSARHLPYKTRVYQALRETDKWLEEALANWSAWAWFENPAIQAVLSSTCGGEAGRLKPIVEAALDLSPPGYRDWRLGEQRQTWRAFANELATAKPAGTRRAPATPLDGILRGGLPYDLRPSDIPVRFVGTGNIAGWWQGNAATFNVPQRRELERALQYFDHRLDRSGGKGGHQKWTGPDERAFILPTRDPVSTGVFKTFLHHLGIDKHTYVHQVRPNL